MTKKKKENGRCSSSLNHVSVHMYLFSFPCNFFCDQPPNHPLTDLFFIKKKKKPKPSFKKRKKKAGSTLMHQMFFP